MKKKQKKRNVKKITHTRLSVLKVLVVFLFAVIAVRLVYVTTIKGNVYTKELERLTERLVEGSSVPRGRILDRNLNVLVDNRAVPVIYYKQESRVKDSDEVELAYTLADKLGVDYKKLSERNLKDFFIVNNTCEFCT